MAASLAIFLVLTIVFAALFGVERGKKPNEQAPEPGMKWFIFYSTLSIVLLTANSDLCLTPYCIKAG